MGRHSSDSDDSHYRRTKKKKKHTRSDSGSSLESYSSKHSKHKKSKKSSKHKHRSRSRSKGRSIRRSRSPSYERKSRSDDRRRSRSRSRQRSRRRRSHSRSRYRRSYSRERSRSPSRPPKEKVPVVKVEPSANIPGFDNMTPGEQAQARLRLALKAAAAADKQLKDQGLLPGNVAHKTEAAILSLAEQQSRAKAIEDIESDSFMPVMFKSTRGQSSAQTIDVNTSHDSAIFGLSSAPTTNIGAIVCMKMESIMHPNLYASAEVKMERWKEKLSRMRKKIIEDGMMIS